MNLADNMAIKSNNFNVHSKGNMSCSSATIKNGKIELQAGTSSNPNFKIGDNFFLTENYLEMGIDTPNYVEKVEISGEGVPSIGITQGDNQTFITSSGITTPTLTQTSKAESKKNFEKLQDNALEKIKNIDIYKYNLKSEKNTDKKHIGFVIGDNYNYSKEVTSIDNQGVDNYSFTSLCCKAIQELSQQVEELKKQLKEGR